MPPAKSPLDLEAFSNLFHARFDKFKLLAGAQVAQLHGHYLLLERWNRVLNLTSIKAPDEVITRHYCESLFLALHLPVGVLSIVDVGSGAGLPGIPVAIMRPECGVSLVESHQRKAAFLKEAARALPNVCVISQRAERMANIVDCLISRAVAWDDLRGLVPTLAPRVALLLSGRDADKVGQDTLLRWQPPIPIPWGHDQVLLLGEVSRGTCDTIQDSGKEDAAWEKS